MKELDERYDGLLLLEPRDLYDRCIIGIGRRFHDRFVMYDEACIIEAIATDGEENNDVDAPDMAREHFEFNVIGGWVGDATPGFMEETQ